MTETAVLLAAYGSRAAGPKAALDAVADRVRAEWPDAPCTLCYTSPVMRDHMRRAGQKAPSPEEALDALRRAGVRRVAIQSLHIIPGSEFHDLLMLANARMQEDAFERIEVGFPLLGGEAEIDRVAEALLELIPERNGNEAVLLMGHGTLHPGHAYYEALSGRLQRLDDTVFLGAMDADPGIADIRNQLLRRGIRKVYLLPFLFGAGGHAKRDMAGDGPASWKSILGAAGLEIEPILKGAGDYESLVTIWLDHLGDAMRRLRRR